MRAEYEAAALSLETLASSVPAPWGAGLIGQASGNWTFPPLSASDFQSQLRRIAARIRALPDDLEPGLVSEIAGVPQRAAYMQSTVMPNFQGNPQAFGISFQLLTTYINSVLPVAPLQDWEELKGSDLIPREVARRVRAIEATVDRVAPRLGELQEKIETIQSAYDAARSLPTDLAALEEAKADIDRIQAEAKSHGLQINEDREKVSDTVAKLDEELNAAKKIVQGIDSAYSAATSIGLSAAFTARADELRNSVKWWVFWLIVTLLLGGTLGYLRLRDFQQLVNSQGAEHWLWISAGMSLLTVAAPIWFAWLATRQIGQRFRLAEDYAYKGAVAKAYEGYRREAVRLDPQLESRLFSSALDRLDEAPLRFLPHEEHGSPYEALFSNSGFTDALAKAIDKFPNVKEAVQSAFAKSTGEKLTTTKPDE